MLCLGLASVACRFLSRMLASTSAAEADATTVKIFLSTIAIASLGLYVAASLAGVGMGLADLVRLGMLSIVAAALVLVGGTMGWAQMTKAMGALPMVRRARAYIETGHEWCIALALCVGAIPLLAYLLLSLLKQTTRRLRGSSRVAAGGLLTSEATGRMRQLAHVHWGSVASKVAAISLIYLTLFVIVAKGVVVFLARLNLLLDSVSPIPIVIIFLLVGVSMFLIPVIPGVPVYVCAGVLLPNALMTDTERADVSNPTAPLHFWQGFLLACAIASLLKFVAIILQQEVIGRFLGGRVAVRAACQINSSFIRAARFVLTQPGCTFGKTMILCGGPDWPTSVLTGILRLSCPKMLLGTRAHARRVEWRDD